MADQKERRKFPRLANAVKVVYKILPDKDNKIASEFDSFAAETSSRNITIQGIGIPTDHVLESGTVVALELVFPESPRPVTCIGKVVWSKHLESAGQIISGVEFETINKDGMDPMAEIVAQYYVDKYKLKDGSDKQTVLARFLDFLKRKKS